MDFKSFCFLIGTLGLFVIASANAHDAPKPRTLTITGEAEVKVAPDRADINLTAEAREKSLADAETKVSETVAKFLKLCESLGIQKSRIKTAQLTVTPDLDYSTVSGRTKIVGYVVQRQMEVDLTDLSKLGRLMQGAVEAGINNVSGPAFGSSKKNEHPRAALAFAAQDARANAETIAKTLGVKLGSLYSLGTSSSDAGERPRAMFNQGLMPSPWMWPKLKPTRRAKSNLPRRSRRNSTCLRVERFLTPRGKEPTRPRTGEQLVTGMR